MATDSLGNVYVTGQSTGSGTGSDFTTIAYDSAGNELWVATYDGPASPEDTAYDMALDSLGNVYVTGYSWISATDSSATVAYDASGNELWVARGESGFSYEIETGPFGNIYITGGSRGGVTGWDYATVAYDPSGNELWAMRYDGGLNRDDHSNDVAVDPFGNVYVTGISEYNDDWHEAVTIKYASGLAPEPTLDIDPDTLNLRSKGRWITAYIEIYDGRDVRDIDISTLLLNETIPAESRPTAIGDHDEDGNPDLMVKFNRSDVQKYIEGLNLSGGQAGRFGYEVTLTLTGMFNDGTVFECSDTIRVLPAERMGTDLVEGPVWTTDMPYPEMRSKAEKLSRKDTVAVEMECSALFALGEFRGVEVGGLVVISDTLFPQWRFDPEESERGWERARKVIARAARWMA